MGREPVYVYRSPVASVTITPGTASVDKGETLELKATLRDQSGRIVKDHITWGSSDFSKVTRQPGWHCHRRQRGLGGRHRDQ